MEMAAPYGAVPAVQGEPETAASASAVPTMETATPEWGPLRAM